MAGVFVSVSVPLLLSWTAGKLKRFLFLAHIHVVISAWHYLKLQRGWCVFSDVWSVRRFCNDAVENHGCPVKMNDTSLSKRIYSLIDHHSNGINYLFITNKSFYI